MKFYVLKLERTRSGVGSRASETNVDDREVKRVRFTESRGEKRQGLHADGEVRAHKIVVDAADATPEQTALFRARRRCSRRLKSHSNHCACSQISMMM